MTGLLIATSNGVEGSKTIPANALSPSSATGFRPARGSLSLGAELASIDTGAHAPVRGRGGGHLVCQVDLARQAVPEAEFIHGDFTEMEFSDGSFDGVVALYAISHVPREQHLQLFADVFRWLVPGGRFLATLGAADIADWTGSWLGDQMFFSSFSADENRRLLCAAGFGLLLDEIAVTREPDGDVSFLLGYRQKPLAVDTSG